MIYTYMLHIYEYIHRFHTHTLLLRTYHVFSLLVPLLLRQNAFFPGAEKPRDTGAIRLLVGNVKEMSPPLSLGMMLKHDERSRNTT